ncbi:hypothetical protein [Planctomonas psychrotolerans]|uniref:hypothetical protein n=1 Tax=Planctomonas psychrotolerans TaxID=2528712 RepID=UPI001D0D7746|nr:hypothetical protein [Planctomonas psychrotolerans]
MTNNEPLRGNPSNDLSADGTAGTTGAAAHRASGDAVPINADDLTVTDDSGLGTTGSTTTTDSRTVSDDVNTSSSAGSDHGDNIGSLGDPAHPFDQTNGIVEGLEGDSDEADGDDPTPA